MTPKLRKDHILSILESQGFATAKELERALGVSAATVHRDLCALEKLHLVKRSWGGVERATKAKIPPLPLRYDFRKREKRHIGQVAAELVSEGDVIFMDGSTTAEGMAPYLLQKKGITVITNNLHLAAFLGEGGIEVICLGGRLLERPFMLYSEDTVENAMKYGADKAFFSTSAFTDAGVIGSGSYHLLHKVMLKNAKHSYFLADHSKQASTLPLILCDFSAVSCVITDHEFPEETVNAFGKEKFISVR